MIGKGNNDEIVSKIDYTCLWYSTLRLDTWIKSEFTSWVKTGFTTGFKSRCTAGFKVGLTSYTSI